MYILNNFRKKKSTKRMFYENSLYFIKWGIRFFQKGTNVKTVLFYPQYPGRLSVIYKVLRELKCNITNNPSKKHNLTIYWQNTTYRDPDSTIIELSKKEKVLNFRCTDISKSKVEEHFYNIFGYSSIVDPETFTGIMVKKSEINATHDGEIINGPTTPEEGFIYQKLIDNSYNGSLVLDIRVPVINDKLPLVYFKFKPISTRFAHYRESTISVKAPEVHPTESVLSKEEIEKTVQFCKAIGLDYGEIDILRDNDDKRIYIIDVNNTPNGPSIGKKMREESVKKLASVFDQEFIS